MDVPPLYLADWLDRARVRAPGASHVEVQTFVIRPVAQTVVFQHPPSRIEWPEMQLGETPRLKASLAIKPFAWDRISAPVVFRVSILDAEETETPLLDHVLDTRNRESDRAWVPVDVSLEKWRGQKVRLVFETLGRPAPPAYGWSGWGTPLLCDASVVKPQAAPAVLTAPQDRPQPDIVLVTCDALRADHLGCYGAPSGATPHLDAFATGAVQVRGARSASDATFASLVSLLTGRLPHETHVTAEWGEFPARLPSLPVLLAGAGYHTILASSELELGAPEAGMGRLFAESIPCLGNPSQHSSLTVRRLTARLKEADPARPLFAWMQLFEPHPPDIPEALFPAEFQGDASQAWQPEAVRGIHGIESALELARSQAVLVRGMVPPSLLHRLEETVRALRGDLAHGPDLASHLNALGARAWNGMSRRAFLQWLAHELQQARKSGGCGSGSLMAWLSDLHVLLADVEADLLSWLNGVQDFRYPMALYAASVKSADHAFGELVDALRNLGRYENALVIFTSPHGELFHVPPQTFEHHALHETSLRVPLLIKPPDSSGWKPGPVDNLMQLDELAATALDYAGVPATGALGRERSRRRALAHQDTAVAPPTGVAVSMQGLAACLYRPPFKLVRFHADGMSWPWMPETSLRRGQTVLLHGEPEVDDTRDVIAEYSEVAIHMTAELERLAPLAAFVQHPLEPARFEFSGEDMPVGKEPAPAAVPAPPRPRLGSLPPLRESDLPSDMKPSDVARLVALEVHQAALELELRDSEDKRSAVERAHRVDATRLREISREAQRLRKDVKHLTRWLEQLGAGITNLYRTRRWRLGSWVRTLRKGRAAGRGFAGVDTILRRFTEWRQGASPGARDFDDPRSSYLQWLRSQQPDGKRLRAMAAEVERLKERPRFGLVMAVPSDANPQRVAEAVGSVLAQSYDGWQLWLLRASADLRAVLPQSDRIQLLDGSSLPDKVTHLAAMGAENLLEPHALLELALHLGKQDPQPDLVYTDEDEIGSAGTPGNPFLKPVWSPDTLESCNYVGALAVYDRPFLQRLGADAEWLAPERAYDTVLRAAEQPGFRAERLPRLLCHRRPASQTSRVTLQEAERQALAGAMQRRGEVAEVSVLPVAGVFRVQRSVWKQEKVVILIPTRDRLALLRRAVDSLVAKTAYRNFEIVIINNASRDPETLAWLARCGHLVFDFPGPFNYAAMHNAAVRATDSPWLLFLNNDTEVIKSDWLTAMAEHVQRPDIGAVGAKLLFPDGSVQHAGVVLGIQDRASHAFANHRPDDLSARAQLQMVRNYSAVTAACMMMRREVYERVGGMDEERFPVAYNDVELCVRALRFGYRNVVTPHAVLKHHECASRPRRDHPGEVENLQRACFGPAGWSDPFYHPALNPRQADFTVNAWT